MNALQISQRALPTTIAGLNLAPLRTKLLEDDALEAERRNGDRLWTEEQVDLAIADYRQFLALMLWHPDADLVPSDAIDEVWHTHVLNTSMYVADCDRIFGRYQHHFPSLGGSEEVLEQHVVGREQTMRLFEQEFGSVPDSYDTSFFKCSRRCGRKCRRME